MKRLIIAAAALSLLGGTAALAQDHDRDHDRDRREEHQDRREIQRDVRRDVGRALGDRDHDGIPNALDRNPNRFNYHGQFVNRFRGPAYVYPRGFGYRTWAHGQYLPRAYFAAPYYADNWTYYRLGPPPIGFRYIRVGPDILLVNLRTGFISETIPGVFF